MQHVVNKVTKNLNLQSNELPCSSVKVLARRMKAICEVALCLAVGIASAVINWGMQLRV